MKNKTLEPKTDSRTSLSPYQAEPAEAQQTPGLRPDPLSATPAPPGSEATVRAHAAGLNRATAGPALRRLQRQYGNRYVQRVVAQRQGGAEGFQLDGETAGRINRARGGGQQLDGAVQAQTSDALGHDFSRVRVHTDTAADTLNRLLSARAFTTGHDIFFRRGEYNPGSGGGRDLIVHELTHVVQQSTGRVSGGGGGMTVRPAGDAFEQEAETLGRGALRSSRISSLQRSYGNPAVQRKLQEVAQGPPPVAANRAGEIINWDPSPGGMNCHGHTYGTWARWHRNPAQGPGGVGVIVAEEAGGVARGPVPAPAFMALGPNHNLQVGNLITVSFGGIEWTHSMRVVATGPNLDDVRVSNVQGYGGPVQLLPLNQVAQMTNPNAWVTVWHNTPRSF